VKQGFLAGPCCRTPAKGWCGSGPPKGGPEILQGHQAASGIDLARTVILVLAVEGAVLCPDGQDSRSIADYPASLHGQMSLDQPT